MSLIFHKLLLLFLILPSLLSIEISTETIAAMLLAIIVSSLCSYFEGGRVWENRISDALNVLLFAAAFLWDSAFPFLPLAAYDSVTPQSPWRPFLLLLPLLRGLVSQEPSIWFTNVVLCVLAVFLRIQNLRQEQLLQKYHLVRDDTTETALILRQKNQELMKNQDYEVELATLAERNRIAREIHDNVGHLLTRSILQVKALQIIYKKDEELTQQLDAVGCTLTDAMDNVRQSVHNLHEESIDLHQQLTRLIEDFTFCPVTLSFDSGRLPKEVNYAVIAIVKEALSNTARHSNATKASISVIEHPSMYQIRIRDNGTLQSSQTDSRHGMGLSNMEERVRAFHGVFHIDRTNGFKIFISIPKQTEQTKMR